MQTYSQHMIEIYLKDRFPTKEPGCFLEIGCWDGILISQTRWLEQEKGWVGLCVDPFPKNFEDRTATLCRRAISADGKHRIFVKVSIDRRYGGDVSYFSGFKENIERHWPLIEEFCDFEDIIVPTITMEQLYETYDMPKHVEFLSVDVEGAEQEIFQSIDFNKWSYGMIDYEHNGVLERKQAISEILKNAGYALLAELAVDDIWVKE